MLTHWTVTSAVETTLGGNLFLSQSKRLRWKTAETSSEAELSDRELKLRNTLSVRDSYVRRIQEKLNDEGQDFNSLPNNKLGNKLERDSVARTDADARSESLLKNLTITLNPMQIRTFLVQVEFKH